MTNVEISMPKEARSPNDESIASIRHAGFDFRHFLLTSGIIRAAGSLGALSSTRNASKSRSSSGDSCFSTPSGISDSLLCAISSMSLRAIVSILPPCTLSTTRCGLFSTTDR